MHIFHHIFLSNYWWQRSDIWSQASYTCRYPISWEAFFDSSDSYFLFAEERGYHKWTLAHSSSCFFSEKLDPVELLIMCTTVCLTMMVVAWTTYLLHHIVLECLIEILLIASKLIWYIFMSIYSSINGWGHMKLSCTGKCSSHSQTIHCEWFVSEILLLKNGMFSTQFFVVFFHCILQKK